MPTPTFGITVPFFPAEIPWYEGGAVSALVPFTYTCSIGGRPYVLEPSQYQRGTVDYQRDQRDDQAEAGEQSLTQKGIWRRFAADWRLGAGQDYWDRPESLRSRFRSSKGIDIWHSDYCLELLYDTREILNSAATNLKLMVSGTYFYVADGTNLKFTTNPATASPSFTTVAAGGTVSSMTTDGNKVFAAVGTDIKSSTLGNGSVSTFSTYDATLVQYANGRLIAAKAGEIVEIDSVGASTVIKTHPINNFTWTTIAGAPNGIYIGGYSGDRTELFFVGVNAATGALTVPIFAGSLPDGETINTMLFYNGVMILGTSAGLRLATLGENSLQFGPLLEVPNGGVTNVELQGEDCWYTWKNYDSVSTGLGRARLSRFTDSLVPAYASDLMATGQGAIQGIVTWGGKRYFSVSGDGVKAEYTNRVASGVLRSGLVEFGVFDPKTLLTVDVRTEALTGAVNIAMYKDDGTGVYIGTFDTQGSLGTSSPFNIPNIKTEAVETEITLYRSSTDNTLGPCFKRWTLRGVPNPNRVDEFLVPIWLKASVEFPQGEGTHITQNPLEEYLFLKDLEQSGAPTRYVEGTQSYDVQISQVILPQDEYRKWTDDRSFLEGLALVHMLTVSVGSTG